MPTLKRGQAPACQVFLDGHIQVNAVEANLSKGFVVRAFLGDAGADQVKLDSGYVFDLLTGDFALEKVYGDVTVAWTDNAAGRRWMEKHCDA